MSKHPLFFAQENEGDGLEASTEQPELHLTMKQGEPYDSWDVPGLVREANKEPGLAYRLQPLRKFAFEPEKFKGYSHQRTFGRVKSKTERRRDLGAIGLALMGAAAAATDDTLHDRDAQEQERFMDNACVMCWAIVKIDG
jgi:hypothetical protein